MEAAEAEAEAAEAEVEAAEAAAAAAAEAAGAAVPEAVQLAQPVAAMHPLDTAVRDMVQGTAWDTA